MFLHSYIYSTYTNVCWTSIVVVCCFQYFTQCCVPLEAKTVLKIKSIANSSKVVVHVTIPINCNNKVVAKAQTRQQK